MEKIDLKKQFKTLYNTGPRAKEPHVVDVPSLQYVMVDGHGYPGGSELYAKAMGALYGVAYAVKFVAKERGNDYGVMPLEGLWWTDPPDSFRDADREAWLWTAMILQPDWITKPMVDDALKNGVEKGKIGPDVAKLLRLERLEEGKAAQVLHIGPYDAEEPTIDRLHQFVADRGLTLRGKHHEIYMSDPRRVAPEKMKTIIRHPVQ